MPDPEYRLIRPNEGLMWRTRMLDGHTFTVDTSPAALPREGEGAWREHAANTELETQLHVTVENVIYWRDRCDEVRGENRSLCKEVERLTTVLAQRDDLIAHYKIGEAGWREEAKGLEAKARNLQANLDDAHRELAKRDEAIAEKDQWIAASHENLAMLANSLSDAKLEAASLRSQLARAGAIEEAAAAYLSLFPEDNLYFPMAKQANRRLKDLLCSSPSPGPRGTAEGEQRKPENNVGCPSRIPPVVSSSDPCPDCGSSRWTPNGDCPKCLERYSSDLPRWEPQIHVDPRHLEGESLASSVIDSAGSIDGNHTHGEFVRQMDAKRRCATTRLAVLERVAKHAKEYMDTDGADRLGSGRAMIGALAELDKTELSFPAAKAGGFPVRP